MTIGQRLNIRQTKPAEYAATILMTREAFWNVYQPGCDEHLVLQQLRSSAAWIQQLDLVAEVEGRLVAHIVYATGTITLTDGRQLTHLGFGPVSVAPDWQRQGIGENLIRHSLNLAHALGYPLVLITGSPAYYARFGFEPASRYSLRLHGVPESDPAGYFMIHLLDSGYTVEAGTFSFDAAYRVDPTELDAFERGFPPKIKEVRPGQLH